VTGITVSRSQARLAHKRNLKANLSAHTSVVRADASALPFAQPRFDLIWVVECLEHLEDKRRFVSDVAALLRPAGRLALCTWQRGEGVPADDPLVQAVCDAFLCPSLASEKECRDWCEQAGLDLVCSEDLTSQVRATWCILVERLSQRWLQPARLVVGRDVRRFLDGFPIIAEAYDLGRMRYGLVVAGRN
jgi:tocopherol O-methyltransferase